MNSYRILLAVVWVLIFGEIGFGGSGGEAEIKAKVMTSNGSMRLVRYTRSSPAGETTHYIRRSPVDTEGRLVVTKSEHARMQSQYVVSRSDASTVRYAPVGGTVKVKTSQDNTTLRDGYGKVYRQPAYSHSAYLAPEPVASQSPVEQVHYADRGQRANVYGAKRASQNVVVVNDVAWSDGDGYRNSVTVKCKRHHRHCGCKKGYSYGYHHGGHWGRGYGYGCTVRETFIVRGGYPRALGDGMYVAKQPRYGYGNYGVRVVARTSYYGHTLTIGGGGCYGRRY